MSFRTATEAYDLIRPAQPAVPLVFASPHSGRVYPATLLARSLLDARQIRSSEDAFVDKLFEAAPRFGAPLLMANAPRAFLDLNRAADEFDPALIEGVDRPGHNPRIASGLGVIPRVVAQGKPIYRGKITRSEAQERLSRYWHPYHDALRSLMEETHRNFGHAILIDCHSMPHEAIEAYCRPGIAKPEIVLGDRYGASASRDVTDRLEEAFTAAGLRVTRNSPFAGAYITQAYGRPSRRQHVVQVEIDRALYLNEARVEKGPGFEAFRKTITGVIATLVRSFGSDSGAGTLAAE